MGTLAGQIGAYQLGVTLGSGMSCTVQVGTHIHSGEQFAVKVMDKEHLIAMKVFEQVKEEIKIMSTLSHKNIIALHEVIETDDRFYLILELSQGGDLFDRIVASSKLDEPTARKYFRELVAAIHHCHEHHVAHMDVKLENILLDLDDSLKLTDFGLSSFQEPGQLLVKAVGTPTYVAPEVISHETFDGLKADLWSCGVVLYAMLAGRFPFGDSQGNKAIMRRVERGVFHMPTHISESAKDLISQLLTVDPANRISLEGIMKHPWLQLDTHSRLISSEIDIEPQTTTKCEHRNVTEPIFVSPAIPQTAEKAEGEGFAKFIAAMAGEALAFVPLYRAFFVIRQ